MMDALNIGALTGSLVALFLYHAYAYGSLCLRKASTLQLTRCAVPPSNQDQNTIPYSTLVPLIPPPLFLGT